MLSTLLESGVRAQTNRTTFTAASVVVHAALITAAAAVTATEAARQAATPETVQVVYSAPRPVPQPPATPAMPTLPSRPAAITPVIPQIAVPSLVDVALTSRFDARTFSSEIPAASITSGTALPGAVEASGVFTVGSVEREVVPRADNPSPVFPQSLRTAGIEGEVMVRFVVDTTGRVERGSVEIQRATHALFAESVQRWLQRTRYMPAEVGSRRVRQLVEQRVDFRLQ